MAIATAEAITKAATPVAFVIHLVYSKNGLYVHQKRMFAMVFRTYTRER